MTVKFTNSKRITFDKLHEYILSLLQESTIRGWLLGMKSNIKRHKYLIIGHKKIRASYAGCYNTLKEVENFKKEYSGFEYMVFENMRRVE